MDLFWQITVVEFLLNVAVFAAAVIAYGPVRAVARRLSRNPRIEDSAAGVLFGGATMLAILMPVHLSGGGAIGGQTVLLALAAPLSGIAAGIWAGVISIGAGLFLWSNDAALDTTMIVPSFVSAALGIAVRIAIDHILRRARARSLN
jgi:hypothetical protein